MPLLGPICFTRTFAEHHALLQVSILSPAIPSGHRTLPFAVDGGRIVVC